MANEHDDDFDFSSIRLCTERNLTGADAIRAAIDERSDNTGQFAPVEPMAMATMAPEMAVVLRKLWRKGRTLKISFWGDYEHSVADKVRNIAERWLDHASLTFDWCDEGGDIRISFTPGGSWSYVGTDAKAISSADPTMNFGWLKPDTDDEEYQRVVLHEFGHALGAIHEHQHPEGGIPWDKPKVYAYYARQGWDTDQVDNNIFGKYSMRQLNSTDYDKESIMHYPVPRELTTGGFEVGWNRDLSGRDKELAERVYP